MNDGLTNRYYDISECKDIDDIAIKLGLTFAEGNCMKALFGIAITRKLGSSRHEGTSSLRDANKLVHYAEQVRRTL